MGSFAHFESMQKGLETFYQSAEMGKSVFEDLRRLSNETTFGVDELARSATELLNVGITSSSLNDTLIQLGNLAQGDKAKFAELTSIYSKVASTGKASSLQLQQLAMRGIPIYDQLKKMGVQGTASLSDLEQVFKNLTEEGGQFYNAMNNINDTIEGKQGFVADYFKEFQANFIEASGLADIYKSALDVIKDSLGWLSDLMLKINENPVWKALLEGTVITILTTLAGVIVGMIIPALITVLSLMAAINPVGVAVGAAIGAVVGIGATIGIEMSKAKKETESLKTSIDGVTQSIKDMYKQLQQEGEVGYIQRQLKEVKAQYETSQNAFYGNEKNAGKSFSETYTAQSYEKEIKLLEAQLDVARRNKENENLVQNVLSSLVTPEEKRIKEIKTQLTGLKEYLAKGMKEYFTYDEKGNVTGYSYGELTKSDKDDVTKVIKALTEELEKLKEPESKAIGKGESMTVNPLTFLSKIEDYFESLQDTLIRGTDVGKTVDNVGLGFDPLSAVLMTMAQDFVDLVSEIDSVNEALDGFKNFLRPIVKVLTPLIDSILEPLNELNVALGEMVAQIIAPFSNIITVVTNILGIFVKTLSAGIKTIGGAFEWFNDNVIVPVGNFFIDIFNDVIDEFNNFLSLFSSNRVDKFDRLLTTSELLADEQEDEYTRLKKLNAVLEDLKDAIEEQETYYLKTKTSLNADAYNSRKVNDMILTPQGSFSTHPNDYIIATKNPNSLGGATTMQVQINNTVSNDVSATATKVTDENGAEKLVIQISRKIASDVANGANGWDSALIARELRMAGRSVYR